MGFIICFPKDVPLKYILIWLQVKYIIYRSRISFGDFWDLIKMIH